MLLDTWYIQLSQDKGFMVIHVLVIFNTGIKIDSAILFHLKLKLSSRVANS